MQRDSAQKSVKTLTIDTKQATSGTVARSIRLLAAVVDAEGPVRVNRLVEETGLPPSTTHRLLALLADEGMVVHNPTSRTYQIGPECYRLSAQTVQSVGLDRIVQPVLEDLAEQFDETVLFGQYSAATGSLIFLARADGDHQLQYQIDLNKPSSLVWGASGKAVTAFLDAKTVKRILQIESEARSRGVPHDGLSRGLPEFDNLERELAAIRQQGFAVSQGEKLSKARGIAVPILGRYGVEGSLTLTHPRERIQHGDIESIVAALQEVAQKIAGFFGANPERRSQV